MTGILLDTNAYSHFVRGDAQIRDVISMASIVYFSDFVLGELMVGFKGGNREMKNLADLEDFIKESFVYELHTSKRTTEMYAKIKDALKHHGTPIPTNDVWIAAHCMEVDATLVTFDRHFERISGLKLHAF